MIRASKSCANSHIATEPAPLSVQNTICAFLMIAWRACFTVGNVLRCFVTKLSRSTSSTSRAYLRIFLQFFLLSLASRAAARLDNCWLLSGRPTRTIRGR